MLKQAKYKPDLEVTLDRMKAFWQHEAIDRACISIPVSDWSEDNYQPVAKDSEDLYTHYFDAQDITDRARKRFERTTYMGDALPTIFPYFGTGGHAAYLGSKYHLQNNTIWLEPCIDDIYEPNISFSKDNETYQLHRKVLQDLVKLSNNEYFIANTDNLTVMDAVANLRGNEDLLCDVMTDPDEVHEVRKIVQNAMSEMFIDHSEILKPNNLGGMTQSWMNLFAHGTLQQLQCDFSVMISSELYKEFVMPELEYMTQLLDYSIYHLDGQEQIRHLDMLLGLEKLDAIQWVSVAGQPKASEFMPVLQKIQKAGKSLVLLPDKSEVDILTKELSCEGLQIVINGVTSKEEANELIKIAEKNAHK